MLKIALVADWKGISASTCISIVVSIHNVMFKFLLSEQKSETSSMSHVECFGQGITRFVLCLSPQYDHQIFELPVKYQLLLNSLKRICSGSEQKHKDLVKALQSDPSPSQLEHKKSTVLHLEWYHQAPTQRYRRPKDAWRKRWSRWRSYAA